MNPSDPGADKFGGRPSHIDHSTVSGIRVTEDRYIDHLRYTTGMINHLSHSQKPGIRVTIE